MCHCFVRVLTTPYSIVTGPASECFCEPCLRVMAADAGKDARKLHRTVSQYSLKPQQSRADDGWLTLWRRQREFCGTCQHCPLSRAVCGRRQGYKGNVRDRVGASGGGLAAGSAVPDTDGGALDGVLSAELADVAGVLCNLACSVSARLSQRECPGRAHLHLLDLLTERGTVTGTVLSRNADLLCACIAINNCPSGGKGQAYAWSFWRCCVGCEVLCGS